MKKSLPIIGLLLTLVVAYVLKGLLQPGLHYPYQTTVAPGNLQLTILQQGYRDAGQCTRVLSALRLTILGSCPSCAITQSACLRGLEPRQRRWLSESPLDVAAARLPNGVALYESEADPGLAIASCRESERQSMASNANARVRCDAPGTLRPLPNAQQETVKTGKTAQELLAVALLILGLVIGGFCFIGRRLIDKTANTQGTDQIPGEARKVPNAANPWIVKLQLAGMDTFVLLLAFLCIGFPQSREATEWLSFDYSVLYAYIGLAAFAVGWFWVVLEHYSRRRTFFDELKETFRVIAVVLLLAGTFAFVSGFEVSRFAIVATWGLAFILVPLGRAIARDLLHSFGLWKIPVVIIGTGENAREASSAIRSDFTLGYSPFTYMTQAACGPLRETQSESHGEMIEGLPVITVEGSLRPALEALNNPLVIFAPDAGLDREATTRLMKDVSTSSFYFHYIPPMRDVPLLDASFSPFLSHELALLTFKNNLVKRTSHWLKRGMDLLITIPCLVLFAPIVLAGAVAIRLASKGNPFYAQIREGYRGKAISVWKLRTMYPDAEKLLTAHLESNPAARQEWETCFKLSNDPRILPVIGSLFRKTSIDELPQLWNVLTGDLSLVGPRPFPKYHLDSFLEDFRELRKTVKPGITGLWQVSARSDGNLAVQEQFDTYYVRNWSIWLDLYILWRTIDTVLTGRGAK